MRPESRFGAFVKYFMSIFDNFTNQYELSKTLRFELKPVGPLIFNKKSGKEITMTEKLLLDNRVFEKDEKIANSYKEAKKWFDKTHREFIDESLKKLALLVKDYEDFEQKFFIWKANKNKKNASELEKIAKKLRLKICDQFDKTAEEWRDSYAKIIDKNNLENKKEKKQAEKKLKKIKTLKGMDLFFKVEVFDFLKNKYPEATINAKNVFNPFNRFGGYFDKFHETRKNFYKDDGKTGRIPTRIIKDNLQKFLENKKVFEEKYKGKYQEIFIDKEKQIFTLEYFNQCFTQRQIDEYNDTIAEIKSKINKFRQNNLEIAKADLPFFKILFKQILGQSKKHQTEQDTFIEIIENKDVFSILQKFITENREYIPKAQTLFKKFIQSQKQKNDDFDIKNIYVASRFLNTINKWFAGWNIIRNILREELKLKFDQKKLPDFVSILSIKNALQKLHKNTNAGDLFREDFENIYKNEEDFYQIFIKIWEEEFNQRSENYNTETKNIEKIIQEDKEYKPNKKGKLRNDREGKIHNEKILDYANSALAIYQMIKYFSLEKGKGREWNPDGLDEDQKGDFYGEFNKYYENVNTWKYFNEFRNYLTKKPYSEEKTKLNFGNSTLADGWDKNKESDNSCVILRKKGKYFLGLMHKDYNDIFKDKNKIKMEEDCGNGFYEKMDYKQIADSSKDIHNLVLMKDKSVQRFTKMKKKQEYWPGEITIIKQKKSYTKEYFRRNDFEVFVNYMKKCAVGYWKDFKFNFSPTENYKNIKDFTDEINHAGYKISFKKKISDKYISEKIENQELYLFQIYNKDFELDSSIAPQNYVFKGKEGKQNLHTIYWDALFSDKNLEETILKLNGQAEIFFRKGSIKEKEQIITKKNKIDKDNHKGERAYKFNRYTENKILFHCPITLNFAKNNKGINEKLRKEILVNNGKINIIGIDRGEKNLAYYSVVNQQGDILDMDSFNKIKERKDKKPTDYHKKLDELEKDRDWQRKSWQEIAKIKEMKMGYISQVVKKICDLIIKYNAIVVFEDLNIGFKRGRFAIEKQVYQNLELALARKLNYLVFKNVQENEAGHHLKAYQLTPKIDNFQDIGRQCGIIFYIPASYTSAICPVCGFRKNISTPVGKLEKNKELVEKFEIYYEKEKDRFKISYERKDFYKDEKQNKKKGEIKLFEDKELKNNFTFYSNVERLRYQRNKNNRGGETKDRNPHKEFKDLFEKNQIDFENHNNVSAKIKEGKFENENFYKPLIYLLSLILQLRNSKTVKDKDGTTNEKENRDFIHCPFCYFHSENNWLGLDKKYKGIEKFYFNGDANGAYNIARKGSLVLQKINKIKKVKGGLEKIDYTDLTITQDEWDKKVQI